jgi:hypothetical protein
VWRVGSDGGGGGGGGGDDDDETRRNGEYVSASTVDGGVSGMTFDAAQLDKEETGELLRDMVLEAARATIPDSFLDALPAPELD